MTNEERIRELERNDARKTKEYNLLVQENRALAMQLREVTLLFVGLTQIVERIGKLLDTHSRPSDSSTHETET